MSSSRSASRMGCSGAGTSAADMNGAVTRTGGVALIAAAVASMLGCGYSPITSSRIEPALETTFANLVELQASRLRLPPMRAPDFAVTAICRRSTAGREVGAGEWTCTIVWQGPDRRTLRDTYDLVVNTDGCYTASVSGESIGGPILTASDGSKIRNLLHTFEGCFDTM
jgi:hypothetical protein